MNFQIRDAIAENMTNHDAQAIRGIVEDALQRGEEHLLPGLGVFFEKLWHQADEEERNKMTGELAQAFAAR